MDNILNYLSKRGIMQPTSKLTTITGQPPTSNPSRALTAANAARQRTNLTAVLPASIWQIIFQYQGPLMNFLMRRVDPGFNFIVVRMELDEEITSISTKEEIEQMATELTPKDAEKSKTLKDLALRRNALMTQRQALETLEIEGKLNAETLLAQARTLKYDLVETLSTIPKPTYSWDYLEGLMNLWVDTQISFTPETVDGLSRTSILFHLARIRRQFDASREQPSLDTLFDLSCRLNMPTFHHPWLANIRDRKTRLSAYSKQAEEYLNSNFNQTSPERALLLLQNEGRELPAHERIGILRNITTAFLDNGDAFAWDLLRLQTPEVSADETAAANKYLAAAEASLKSGDFTVAFRIVRDHLISIDPETDIMRFPDQCMRFLEHVINLPKELRWKMNSTFSSSSTASEADPKVVASASAAAPKVAASASSATAAPEDIDIEAILTNLIINLPEGARKDELVKKAQKNGFSSLGDCEVGKVIWYSLFPQPENRQMNLCKLARIFFEEGDFQRFFAVTKRLSPPFAFGALDQLLILPDFIQKYSYEFLQVFNNLPDEFQFLLIEQAKTKGQQETATLLEAVFNRAAFRLIAEQEFEIVVSGENPLLTPKEKDAMMNSELLSAQLVISRLSSENYTCNELEIMGIFSFSIANEDTYLHVSKIIFQGLPKGFVIRKKPANVNLI